VDRRYPEDKDSTATLQLLDAGILLADPKSAQELGALWDRVAASIDPLRSYEEGQIPGSKLREETILAQSSTVHTLAAVAARALASDHVSTDTILNRPRRMNWLPESEAESTTRRIERREARTRRLIAHSALEPDDNATSSQ
jgi:hypothetical protein